MSRITCEHCGVSWDEETHTHDICPNRVVKDPQPAQDRPKAREFIACKRTENSQWQYAEYSESTNRSFDTIAPDCGNYLKLRLIEISALTERDAVIKDLMAALESFKTQMEMDQKAHVIRASGIEETIPRETVFATSLDWYENTFLKMRPLLNTFTAARETIEKWRGV